MRKILLMVSALALTGCDAITKPPTDIMPAQGIFSEAEETVYEQRFAEMVKAFASGPVSYTHLTLPTKA